MHGLRIFIFSAFLLLLGACHENIVRDTAHDVPPDMHTSEIALDWPGTYSGTLPCADCPGIDVTVTLRPDGTYEKIMRYMERDVSARHENGSFEWHSNGNVIILKQGDLYHVGENTLIALDAEGQRIQGPLADHFKLQKINQLP